MILFVILARELLRNMSDFVVSARKYRPVTFDTVVGQSSITTTLKNAIRNKHLAQAFLFCGPRGVGKTTCARILAKTINCTNINENVEACNECESCISFNNNQSFNVHELDGASNNSVDDMRNLVDQVRFPPQTGKFKIYIIDEVHMLSSSAFNAFLKTLEEPPPYAIFILATTEKHKIIPTILSRCQIFDFSRIRVDDIAQHLEWIAEKENVVAEPDALHIIAQKAEGALRDALSIFDQVVSFSGSKVTYKDVITNLNVLDYDYYFRITDHIIESNIPAVFLTFNELLNEGFDGHHFINGFSSHLRDLLVCQDEVTLQLLEVSKNIRDKYQSQSQIISATVLYQLLDIANVCDVEYRAAKNQRLHVELALLKMCRLQSAASEKKSDAATAFKNLPLKPQAIQEPAPPVSQPEATNPPTQTIPKSNEEPSGIVPKTPSIRLSSQQNKLSEKKNEAGNPASSPAEEKEFSADELLGAWTSYAKKLESDRRWNLLSTMSKRNPALKENFLVEFAVDNDSQVAELNLEKKDLLDFLRKQLLNSHIQLTFIVIEKKDTPDEAYTAAEKFKKMAEKNPALNKLQRAFDLEF